MPQVSLAEYRHRITEQIENGHIDEAIAHCRHVLAHHPRYLSAYKLLAHACLEKGDFAHANHFFQCVLSADLEDADAWINLALLAEDLGETRQAIWLLERAFEVAPGNTRVREILRQLYAQRDGAERTRIKLTPTALARLYAKGGFYQRAIRELEKMLQESANLPRLQVATLEVSLAQALWNTEDMASLADQVCQSLLDKVPFSLQANLILGEIRTRAGRQQESEPHLQVARVLDPEGELAHELLGHRSPLPLQDVEIPYLEYETPPLEEAQAVVAEAEDTSWLDRIGASVEPLDLEDEQNAPAWIKNWTENEALMPTITDQEPLDADSPETESEGALSSVEPPQDTAEVPDWLLEVQRESVAPDVDEEIPDWLQSLPDETEDESEATTAEQLPDWLQELDAQESLQASPQAEDQPTLKGDLPDWLIALSEAETLGEEDVLSAAEDELPDWTPEQAPVHLLDRVQPDKVTKPLRAPTPPEDAIQPEQAEELPQWFDELRQEAEAASAEIQEETALVPAVELGQDEAPDWLRELSDEDEIETPDTPVAEEAKRTAPLEAALPPPAVAAAAGLTIHAASQEEPLAKAEMEELPNWLSELEAEISGAQMPAPAAQAVAPEAPTAPPPAIPPETPETVLEPAPEKETTDWLEELEEVDELAKAEMLAETEPEAILEAALEPMPDDELPDWLRELRTESEFAETVTAADQEAELALAEESVPEPLPDEELPDWLQQLRPAGEPQPDRAAAFAVETEPVLSAEPPEPQAEQVDEIVPALSEEMEDMEWLRELEEATADKVQVEPEPPIVPAIPIVQAPEAEQPIEEPMIARVELPALGAPEAPPAPVAVEPSPVEEAPVPQAQAAETRLALARTRLSESALDDSAQEYERLVREPDLAAELTEELEQAVQTHPKHHALQRVLGDAYMRTGKLQKALEAYRQALNKL